MNIFYLFLYYLVIILGIILFIILLISYKKYTKNNNFKVIFRNEYKSNEKLGSLIYVIHPNLLISLVLGSYFEIVLLFNFYKDIEFFSMNYSFSGLALTIFEIITMIVILWSIIWYSSNKVLIYENAMVIKRIFFSKVFYFCTIEYIQSFRGTIFSTDKIYGYIIVAGGEVKYKLQMWKFKELYKIETSFNEKNKNVVSVSNV